MKKRFYDNPSLKSLALFLLFLMAVTRVGAQSYSVKADVLGLAMGTFNAEASMAINLHWSIHLPVAYNPWTFSGDKKIKHLTFLPGARYWIRETYGGGLFFGSNAIVSRYNFAGLPAGKYRYDGMGYGIGLSAGYNMPMAKRWNIEFELGGGIIFGSRDKYPCGACEEKIETQKGAWLVPDKAAISIVYLF